jgi:hypothetical protein
MVFPGIYFFGSPQPSFIKRPLEKLDSILDRAFNEHSHVTPKAAFHHHFKSHHHPSYSNPRSLKGRGLCILKTAKHLFYTGATPLGYVSLSINLFTLSWVKACLNLIGIKMEQSGEVVDYSSASLLKKSMNMLGNATVTFLGQLFQTSKAVSGIACPRLYFSPETKQQRLEKKAQAVIQELLKTQQELTCLLPYLTKISRGHLQKIQSFAYNILQPLASVMRRLAYVRNNINQLNIIEFEQQVLPDCYKVISLYRKATEILRAIEAGADDAENLKHAFESLLNSDIYKLD